MNPQVLYTTMPSPIGTLTLTSESGALSGIHFDDDRRMLTARANWTRDDAALATARHQLEQYFARRRAVFDLPLLLRGTEFQRKVWAALREIPFGATAYYSHIARRIGSPTACRAVGAANGQNPIPIVVPCHRVIGADGSLTGYAGGEARKQTLLDLEKDLPAQLALQL